MALRLVSALCYYVQCITSNNFIDGVDYSPGPYSVTLHADMTRISFDISITDDNVPEPDETFRLAINSRPLPNYIKFGTKGSTVTIINDDSNGKSSIYSYHGYLYFYIHV